MRALSIVFIASYCFIVGILGIIFNLPGLQSQSALVVWLGVSALIVGALLLASAYGLLKLQSWGPLLTTIALVSSIVFAVTHISLDPMSPGVRWWAIAIAIAAAADLVPAEQGREAVVRSALGRPAGSGMSPLLEMKGLSKRFGGFVALDGIDLDVQPGERLGLIGPNGSGKSTLVNCVCGTLHNETGSVHFAGQALDGMAAHRRTHMGLARSFQLPRPFMSLTVMDNLRIPLLYTVRRRSLLISSPQELDDRCIELLRMVGLDAKARRMPSDLTQVEMRKLELARAMAAEPKLLIADEAMAGLSHSEIEDIIALLLRLNEQGITIIMIEHIMRAVMSFSQRIAVLVSGRKIADGKPDEVVNNPEVVSAYLGQ